MRVLLTHNVPKLGEVGDVRDVPAGYGRNYLIPQGLAVLATPGALKKVDELKRAERRRQDKVRAEMEDVAREIGRLHLTFPARVGETGRLYGSITAANIAEAIESETGHEFDRRKIILDESIRTLGEHLVPIHLMPGVDAEVRVEVVADGELVPDIGLLGEMDDEGETDSDGEPVATDAGSAGAEGAPEALGTNPHAYSTYDVDGDAYTVDDAVEDEAPA